MAIGLEDGSASRNATLGTTGAIWPLPMVMRPRPRWPGPCTFSVTDGLAYSA